jgi:hypothetical protein
LSKNFEKETIFFLLDKEIDSAFLAVRGNHTVVLKKNLFLRVETTTMILKFFAFMPKLAVSLP